jgi:hypothetical protein
MNLESPYIVELADTLKHHWYAVWRKNKKGEKGKFLGFFPSVSTILNAYPQSEQLTYWIAEQGWNESQAIKSEAGEQGTKVHAGIELLLGGGELDRRSYKLKEWLKLSTFKTWHEKFNPEIIALELPVFSPKHGYTGRLDCLAKIAGEIYLIDWKTSSSLHNHFQLQFSAYAQAMEEVYKIKIDTTAVLQMGASNKDGYRFVAYPDWKEHFEVFKNVKATWQYDNFDSKNSPKGPPVLILPDTLKL